MLPSHRALDTEFCAPRARREAVLAAVSTCSVNSTSPAGIKIAPRLGTAMDKSLAKYLPSQYWCYQLGAGARQALLPALIDAQPSQTWPPQVPPERKSTRSVHATMDAMAMPSALPNDWDVSETLKSNTMPFIGPWECSDWPSS